VNRPITLAVQSERSLPTLRRTLHTGVRVGSVETKRAILLYVLALVVVVVGVDVLFLSHHFLERLLINVGIVLVFATFYLAVLKRQ
jgi:hypothetical protein